LTQTASVKPGDPVAAGGLLATSNFTDASGHLALGLNLRTGYLPWAGPSNYEDAVVVSRSAAEKLTARQTFQLGLGHPQAEATPVHRYASLFPGRYDKAALAPLGDDGVVRVGQTVTRGQPLVLAAAERPLGGSRVLRRAGPAFADHTVTWDHDDPGVVTDVAHGPSGPVVVVRADRPSRVGDKVAGSHGDKGVIAKILPDDEMPVAADGKPLEYLASPTGIVSRANPAQTVELVLSRVARKLGRPVTVPDFGDEDDLAEWARRLAREHGVAATEAVTDPRTGRTIPGVPVGERFVMKLHHQAEDKLQARDGGGYDSDGRPTRGGPGGCLHGDTPVFTPAGLRRIADLVAGREARPVDTPAGPRPVSDWFERWALPAELVTVTLSDGSALHLTRGHAVHRADGSRAAAADLRPGDRLG
jgi:DNA-directed RNA polymerase subunit beta